MRCFSAPIATLCAVACMTACSQAPANAAAASAASMNPVSAASKNTTGLPDYPGAGRGIMDDVYRDYMGRQCTHYATNAADELAKVEGWYREHMAAAKESDVNENSLYGSIFKLDGIHLQSGTDFANVYRTKGQQDTSIELFKCKT